MERYKPSENQSFLDIAIQMCGSLSSAFELAVKNGRSVTDELAPGESLDLTPVDNPDLAAYWVHNNLAPATAKEPDPVDPNRIFDLELPIEFS